MNDPVCGMKIDSTQSLAFDFENQKYFFCCDSCLGLFKKNPKKYLEPKANREACLDSAVSAHLDFTCPMHPEVTQKGPGDCPICGMSLEPMQAGAADAAAQIELDDYKKRFWIGVFLGSPLMGLSMAQHHANSWQKLVQLALCLPIIFYSGLPILKRALKSVQNRNLNMFTLLGLGSIAALIQGLLSFILPFEAVYFETAAWILLLSLLGQYLELKARSKTGDAIRALLMAAPRTVIKTRPDRKETVIATSEIQIGDWIRVPPGARVPVDGKVIDGISLLDESMMTGEPTLIEKSKGSHLVAGTLNQNGSLVMRAIRVGSETTLARIIELVSQAQRSQAPIQRLADRVAGFFVPAVIGIAILTAIGWAVFGPEPKLIQALINSITVLVIACPCALGLATPMSVMVSAGRSAQLGVLIRNAEVYEKLEQVDIVVFDKTGTLTLGKPTVERVSLHSAIQPMEFWALATALETPSEHPLSRAVLDAATLAGVQAKDLPAVSDFLAVTGQGVQAKCNNRQSFIGKESFLLSKGVSTTEMHREAQSLREQGFTLLFLAREGLCLGVIGIRDPLRPEAPEVLRALKRRGLEILLLTGDHIEAAYAITQGLPIDRIEANLTPEQKILRIRDLQKNGFKVAMVGDGINDAPALAQSQVGFAMGTGSEAALATSAVTLLKGNLHGIVTAFEISQKTLRNIRQNLFWAFSYNFLGIPLATGAFVSITGWMLSPMFASLAMSLSSIFVILNALRLKKFLPSEL